MSNELGEGRIGGGKMVIVDNFLKSVCRLTEGLNTGKYPAISALRNANISPGYLQKVAFNRFMFYDRTQPEPKNPFPNPFTRITSQADTNKQAKTHAHTTFSPTTKTFVRMYMQQ
jgi:hypothetical protein